MVITPVGFELELSHSIGMSGERHQMVCEERMEIVKSVIIPNALKSEVCILHYYTAKGVLDCLHGHQWDEAVWLCFAVKGTRKATKTNHS